MSNPTPARWLLLLALPLASCVFVVADGEGVHAHSFWGRGIRGTGVRAEEHRTVDEFHAIDFETSGTVVVRVGEAPSVHLSGDDNLLREVETTVRNGVLSIDVARSCDFRCGLEVVIGTPSLDRFSLEGSGDVKIQDLAGEKVSLTIEGSGTLRATGTAGHLVGSIDGSGDLWLGDLEATEASLSIEGSGSMEVRVARSLHYSIEGSGSIRYAGGPELSGHIDGSGDVARGR